MCKAGKPNVSLTSSIGQDHAKAPLAEIVVKRLRMPTLFANLQTRMIYHPPKISDQPIYYQIRRDIEFELMTTEPHFALTNQELIRQVGLELFDEIQVACFDYVVHAF